jgi:threonine dehydratase
MTEPTPDDVAAAHRRIAPHIVRTPMLRNAALDARTGATVLLKPEPLQRTGSFKLRGATNALRRLDARQRRRGVVAYSSGNHGQAVACAAAALDMPATVFMPAHAPAIKQAATRAWGAQVVLYDWQTEDREALARVACEATGAVLIPPYEHADVIAGQGSLALELIEDAAAAGLALDTLLVCTGGGGLVAGCALAAEAAGAAMRLFAVEPEGWDDTARSLAAGARLANAPGAPGLCDALMARLPGELTFSINRARLAGGLVVSEAAVREAVAFAFRHLKLVVEPGGAVALAAALAGGADLRGRVVGVVLSGGNVDVPVFLRLLEAAAA